MEALAWIDLETTGLNPSDGLILEMALVVTDMGLNVLATREWLGFNNGFGIEEIKERFCDEFVLNMHTNNGLFSALENFYHDSGSFASWKFNEIITDALVEIRDEFELEAVHPAGSSIHFDVAWLKEHCPDFSRLLHYRQLDVTSLKIAQQIKEGSYEKDTDIAHRAMADIQQSLQWARDYIFGMTTVVETLATEVEDEATRLLHQMKLDNV